MKLLLCFILFSMLNVSGSIFSQSATFNLAVNGKTVKEVFKDIESESQYRFLYNDDFAGLSRIVSFNTKDNNIDEVLDELLAGAHLTYRELENDLIVITPLMSTMQEVTITGTVTDSETGSPLPGATIAVGGTAIGTATGSDGKYSLVVPDRDAVLVFSYIGYVTREIIIGEDNIINVSLDEEIALLDEIVVIGYGTQRKVNLTGAVSAVQIDERISSRGITNVSAGLSGLMPGLTAVQNTGMAGNDGAELLIRGVGSPNQASPLIVIDGIPDVNINNLNINDVESISVLKDAASASIYGSRGANGVILITTKRGGINQPMQINYTGNLNARSYTNYYQSTSDYPEYMLMHNRARMTGGRSPVFVDGTIEQWMAMGQLDPIRFPNTNWWDVLFKTGYVMNHSLSASGGSERINYYVSAGSMDDTGVSVNTDYSRRNFRSNIDSRITDNIMVGINFDGIWTDQSYGYPDGVNHMTQGNIRWDIIKNSPGSAPMDEQGRYGWNQAYREHSANRNIYATMMNRHTNIDQQVYVGNVYVSWEAISKLVFRLDYGLNHRYQTSNNYNTPFLQWNFQTDEPRNKLGPTYGGISNSYVHTNKSLLQGRVNYNIDIMDGHNLSFVGVYAEEHWQGKNLDGSRSDRIHPGLYELNSALLDRPPSASGSSYGEGLRSMIGRMNYNIEDKYLFETNLRVDASSKFLEGYEQGIFPSFSAAWRLSQEDFFTSELITEAKIRGSLGSLGNNAGVGRYEQHDTYILTNYTFGQGLTQGVSSNKMINPDFSWESTKVTNFGFDIVFFNQLSAELDLYERLTSDIIRPSELSSMLAGYSAPRTNIGELQNRGIELDLMWRDNIGEFQYRVRFNYSHNKNKLLTWNQRLGLGEPHLDYPLSFVYTYKSNGIAQTWEDIYNAPYQGSANMAPGDILYKDVNGDGKIEGNDRVALKNSPRSFFNNHYGLLFDASWRNFDVNVHFQASSGSKEFWYDNYNMPYPNGSRYTYNQEHLEAWTLHNRENPRIPRLVIGSGGRNSLLSDYWL